MAKEILFPSIISSFIEVIITQPIDVAKTFKQTNMKIPLNLKTLYSGFIPRASGNIPSRSIFLFSQDYLKTELDPTKKTNKILIPGKKYPKLTPVIIDRNIQSVK